MLQAALGAAVKSANTPSPRVPHVGMERLHIKGHLLVVTRSERRCSFARFRRGIDLSDQCAQCAASGSPDVQTVPSAAKKSRPTCSNCSDCHYVPVSSCRPQSQPPHRIVARRSALSLAAPRSSLGLFNSMLLNATPSRLSDLGGAPILRVLMSVVGEPPPPPGPRFGLARGEVEKISCPSKKKGLFSEKNVS